MRGGRRISVALLRWPQGSPCNDVINTISSRRILTIASKLDLDDFEMYLMR